MKIVVLLALLVSSVAFSSEQEQEQEQSKFDERCAKLFDRKKLEGCFEGKRSFVEGLFIEISNFNCLVVIGGYLQCEVKLLRNRVEELEQERQMREFLERERLIRRRKYE